MRGEEARAHSVLLRWVPSLCGGTLYALFISLWLFAPNAYALLLHAADAMPMNAAPFGDLGAVLQAGVCWRHGVNVYAPNVCMFGGQYNYAPSLLRLADLNVGPQDRVGGGLFMGALFLAAMGWLPPARSAAELVARIFAICSETVIFALERANFDVVMLLLVMAGVALLLANRMAAVLGYLLFVLAAAAKFYPASLLLLIVRERPARILAAGLVLAVAAVFYAVVFGHGTMAALHILPLGFPFSGIFGAINLPYGIVLLRFLPQRTLMPGMLQGNGAVLVAMRVMDAAAVLAGFAMAPRYRAMSQALDEKRQLLLMVGAIVITFCFFAAQNISYRGIFLLLTLPAVWPATRSRAALVAAILFLLWEDCLRNLIWVVSGNMLTPAQVIYPKLGFWLVAELVWWWVVIQFLALIFCYLQQATGALRPTPGAQASAE